MDTLTKERSTLKKILFYDPAEDGRKYLALHWLANLLLLLIWSFGVGVVSLFFGHASYSRELFFSYFRADLLALNILPVLALALLIFLIFNRMWPAVLGSGAICVALSLIDYFKLLLRSDPLLVSDIRYLFEAARISSRYDVRLSPLMIACLAGVLAGAVFAFFLMKARFRAPLPRILSAAALAAACVGLYFGVYTKYEVYATTENLDVEFADGYRLSRWNDTDQYCSRGFLYPLIYSARDIGEVVPAGYGKNAAQALLDEYGTGDIPEEKKVNVVSIMLEAYCDLSLYPELFPFDPAYGEADPYEFFHELQAESYHGTLVTNIFAGNTIDTERAYITGSARLYDYTGDTYSYARYFSDQGYLTEFCHPFNGWFYHRKNIAEYFGFERGWFFENRYELPMGVMEDAEFFSDIAALFDESAAAGRPYFNFSVTYQNHGPYDSEYLDDPYTWYLSHEGLSEESYIILTNYFNGIRKTDAALRGLVAHFRESEEPVVLVLFGDHKPWLGDGNSVYKELGIDLDGSTAEGFYNYHATQYTIWANDAAKEVLGNDFAGEGEDLSPCFLMMKLFDLCGWEGPAYLKAERELFEDVTVVSTTGRYLEYGKLVDALGPETREMLDRLLIIQYYYLCDWTREA